MKPTLLLALFLYNAMAVAQRPATFFQPPLLQYAGPCAIADFNGDGNLDIALSGSDLTIELGDGKGNFRGLTPLAYNSVTLVAGDFNGDGKIDLALADKDAVVILIGRGDGTFALQKIVAYLPVTNIAAADLNGDGKLDLLVTSKETVFVLLGNGDATFKPPVATAAVTSGPIVVADFNSDGHPDLATQIGAGSSMNLEISLGKGDGSFASPITTNVSGGYGAIVAADFTGDGIVDIALGTSGGTQILIGTGDGNFTYGQTIPVFSTVLAAADLNGDGKLDLVSADLGISILLNKGGGVFQTNAPVYQSITASGGLGVAQFRKTGPPDVLAQGVYYRNLGNGKLEAGRAFRQPFPVSNGGAPVAAVASGDFNGDGKQDLVLASESSMPELAVAVMPGDGHGNFGRGIITRLSHGKANSGISSLIAGDFNHDGKLDLALNGFTGSTNTHWVVVMLGNGDGTFGKPVQAASLYGVLAAGDFNRDGNLDLAALDGDLKNIVVMLGHGDGTFAPPVAVGPVTSQYQLITADLNLDGNLDLITPNDVYLGNGDGTFHPAPAFNGGGRSVVAADFNGDGIPDLATGSVEIFIGRGDGTFEAQNHYPANGAVPLLTGDFNHDGIVDILSYPDLLLGRGDGTFVVQSPSLLIYPDNTGENVSLLVSADFNGDGKPDLGMMWRGMVTQVINTTR